MTAAARSREFSRTMRLASLALGYPDDQWWRDIPLMDTAADSLSGPPQAAMRRYLGAVAGLGPGAAQRAYVDTFDLRRRCCPYLTYYSCGDTRKRGMALLEFTAAYRVAGFELIAVELPDHLAVLCEFTAAVPEPGPRPVPAAPRWPGIAAHGTGRGAVALAARRRRDPRRPARGRAT